MESSPFQYTIHSAVIYSPRSTDDTTKLQGYDVSNIIAELNLYESLDSPYVTGTLVLADSVDYSTLVNFTGQERITINLSVEENVPLEKTFVIYTILTTSKGEGDGASVYTLGLIEEHGFVSEFMYLSEAIEGNVTDSIEKIFKTRLGVEFDGDNIEEAAQSFRYVIPNMRPLDVCMLLKDRATSKRFDEPFFLYSALKDGMHFQSLGELMSKEVLNEKNAFVYTHVQSLNFAKEGLRILQLTIPENDNTMLLAESGAMNTKYISIDTFNRGDNYGKTEANFNMVDHFNKRKDAGRTIVKSSKANPFYNPEFTIEVDGEQRELKDLGSQYMAQINTSEMFKPQEKDKSFPKSIHEERENKAEKHLHKAARLSDLAMLEKQMITIMIPGYYMMFKDENTSIGRLIKIKIPVDRPLTSAPDGEDETLDKKRSDESGATYLVYDARHVFTLGTYKTVLTLVRSGSNIEVGGKDA